MWRDWLRLIRRSARSDWISRSCSKAFLQLAGEPLVVHEVRGAIETPGGIGDFFDERGFCGGGLLVLVEKPAAVELVGGCILGTEDRGAAGEAVGFEKIEPQHHRTV